MARQLENIRIEVNYDGTAYTGAIVGDINESSDTLLKERWVYRATVADNVIGTVTLGQIKNFFVARAIAAGKLPTGYTF